MSKEVILLIEGAEKVIVSHERKAENRLYIVKSQDTSYSLSAQIKSVPNDSFKYARTTALLICTLKRIYSQ